MTLPSPFPEPELDELDGCVCSSLPFSGYVVIRLSVFSFFLSFVLFLKKLVGSALRSYVLCTYRMYPS